ncbi:MAG: cation-translocating P-type ATPase [Halobacteria archaeon]|nr:cation-translocating P-type ATPase [Halobacteria archaeon]
MTLSLRSEEGSDSTDTDTNTDTEGCDLCDLPTPDPPVTRDDVDGGFCCRGCLEVYSEFGEVDPDEVTEYAGDETETQIEDPETEYLAVDGMHCSTCEAFIESQVASEDGVGSVDASYASDMVKVSYDDDKTSEDEVRDAVTGFGYRARSIDVESPESSDVRTAIRLGVGGILGMITMMLYIGFLYPMYFGFESSVFGSSVWGSIIPTEVWLLTTVILVVTGFPILRGAYVSLRSGQPNMDLLVAVAAVGAYVYSAGVVLTGGNEIYFDITVVIVVVVSVGNYYEERIKRRATDVVAELKQEKADKARRVADDGHETVGIDRLDAGDRILVKPGERIPVDGKVVEGTPAVDESLVTGESVPVRKQEGDQVIGGSVVAQNAVTVEVADEATSTLDRLVELLWEIQSSRPGVQRLADKIAGVFVPLVLTVAAVTFAAQVALGSSLESSVLTALSVLIVSCPCALGVATPLAVASGINDGLRHGIVVNDPSVFEKGGEVETVAFDKTGTVTTGEMEALEVEGDEEAVERAAAVEEFSSHHIADALTSEFGSDREAEEFRQHPGMGVSAEVKDDRVYVGSSELFDEKGLETEVFEETAEEARESGKVPVFVGWDDTARAVVVVGDKTRDGWEETVEEVADGREVAIITGDTAEAAERFEGDGVDHVFAEVPPEAKAEIVERLRAESDGATVMVGDGTNDAPALAKADLGIAVGDGTTLAVDAADVVNTTDDIRAVPEIFEMTEKTRRRIRHNLGWAFLYNAVAIPAAVTGHINPVIAAVAMATSSLLVVANSSRSVV